MSEKDERQRVGLFYSYTPEKACFLGWAMMSIDRQNVDAETRAKLAVAGKFDGTIIVTIKDKEETRKKKQKLSLQTPAASKSQQYVYELETGEKVYEQECWSASEHYAKLMFSTAEEKETVNIRQIRQAVIEQAEMAKDEARVLRGYVDIGVNFKLMRVSPDDCIEDLILDKLLAGGPGENPFFGCDATDIMIKVRSDEDVLCTNGPEHGVATEVFDDKNALCPKCQSEK